MPVEQIDFRIMAALGLLCGVTLAVVIITFKNRKTAVAERRKSTTLRMAKVASELPEPPEEPPVEELPPEEPQTEEPQTEEPQTEEPQTEEPPPEEPDKDKPADIGISDAAPVEEPEPLKPPVVKHKPASAAEILRPTDTKAMRKKKRRLPETVRLKARMVLLVDDTAVNRDIIAMFFEESGVKFDFAVNGKEACEKFEQDPDKYGVILMDIQMPEMDGLEAAARIRAHGSDWAKQIPIVAMTADAQKDDIDKCFDAGMDDHIAKPVDLDTLQEKVFEFVSMGME